ncbi:PAS domain-containing sensor histidine kinase [uncultured Desulfuromonas sp.]|uniref:PAS domain-containing sensor histidine kinase n=1 Tax=uncultured Desulfuromonas sp. TaxID=181013 RepID=UPI002631D533|nr:PAS domain-containing sensor histidine kinase [uncultured Desulfuromonas sp.]
MTPQTDPKARSAALERDNSRLRSVLDAMSDLAYIASNDFRVEYMNRAMIETFGDQVGETCYTALFGCSAPCSWCPLPRVRAGETVREERSLPTPPRTYEIIHSPLRDTGGELHKLAVFRDITERKRSERRLREVNQELDAFTYTVSHDLRTLLTPIIGFAEFLQDEYRDRLDSQVLDILQEIETQGLKMHTLMEDLLVLARLGSLPTPTVPVDTGRIISGVLHDIEEQIRETGAEVRTEKLDRVLAPEPLLSQVFTNLITNALKYGAGPGRAVVVGSERCGDATRFFVRDHGPGIPPQERGRIFDLFYRGTTAGANKGTGVGLATVRKIVRLLNGRVWVDETPGGGSTFWMELPCDSPPAHREGRQGSPTSD